jgi:hypothetical protein
MDELDSATTAEAVGAQALDCDPHRGEGMRREGQEDGAFHALPEVQEPVQAGVLPLPVDGQAVDRKANPVQRGSQGPNVGGPRGELARPLADVPNG